jgi:hypothetical protein
MVAQRAVGRGATAIAQAAVFTRIFPSDRDSKLVEIDHN